MRNRICMIVVLFLLLGMFGKAPAVPAVAAAAGEEALSTAPRMVVFESFLDAV